MSSMGFMTSLNPNEELRAAERTMILVRWAAVPFALVQVLTYYMPYPGNTWHLGLLLVALLAAGSGLIHLIHLRSHTVATSKRLSAFAFAFDFAIIFAFVWLYSFDVNTAMFVMVYLLPLEGAIRYQRAGALGVMGLATVVYALRELHAAHLYGHDFLLTSISFRMGVGFLIASVAGAMALRFWKERQRVQSLYHHERAAADTLRELNAIKSTFLGAVSHELRTPMTSILGFALTLQAQGPDVSRDEQQMMIDIIATEASRIDRLMDDLLDVHRLARGQLPTDPQPIDMSVLAHDIAAWANEQGREIELDVPSAVTAVADEHQVRRIMEHLVSNALKYGGPKGNVNLRLADTDQGVQITVHDDGPGVPDAEREHIFESFRRGSTGASSPSPGTGVGLALVKRFAELHGGWVWIEDDPMGGATFCVMLPHLPAISLAHAGQNAAEAG